MADLIVPGVGQVNMLDKWLSANSFDLTFHLYDNDVTPDFDSLLGDFNESSYSGYSAFNGLAPFATADSVAQDARSGPILVGFNGPNDGSNPNVYGWFCTENSTGALIAAVRFDSAPLVLSGIDSGPIFAAIIHSSQTTIPAPPVPTFLQLDGVPSNAQNTDWNVTVTAFDQYGSVYAPYAGSVSFALGSTITAGGDAIRVLGAGGAAPPFGTLSSGVGTFTVRSSTVGSPVLPASCFLCAGDGTIGGSMPRFPVHS